MREEALHFLEMGCNCSQCILRAAEQHYHRELPPMLPEMCGGITGGFGVGGFCSALVAGVMVFGWFFDEETVKLMRIRLINGFCERQGAVDCGRLQCLNADCANVIGDAAELVQQLVDEELEKRERP